MGITKATAIREHFDEAYARAKGRYSTVTARQVYYALREILNRTYGLDLDEGKGYYGHFTQERLAEKFDEDPSLEDTILLEGSGTFRHPFFGTATPIGTSEVRELIAKTYLNRIYPVTQLEYDLEPELLYRQVLFVEKQGFTAAFEESGMLERLNLGLISVQGRTSRAAKLLMRDFNERGITVYSLHDCDVFGYDTHMRIRDRLGTFKEPLDIDIGLTIDDVEKLEKRPEHVASKKDYSKMMAQWPADVRDFFMPNPKAKLYRRVELNALTNDELIALIEARIKPQPLIPPDDVIEGCITIDKEAVLKDALLAAVRFLGLSDTLTQSMHTVDAREIIDIIHDYVNVGDGRHWARGLSSCVGVYRNEFVQECAYKIVMMLQEAGFGRYKNNDR